MQHAPRYDRSDVDPLGLKPKLAMFANATFNQMWHSSAMRERIIIGKHNLECPDEQFEARFTNEQTGWYDGVHMYGRSGKKIYTNSLANIFKYCLPTLLNSDTPANSDNHSDCPQARFRNMKKTTKPRYQPSQHVYSVPVANMFDILGN